jgi:hypothetical protein
VRKKRACLHALFSRATPEKGTFAMGFHVKELVCFIVVKPIDETAKYSLFFECAVR